MRDQRATTSSDSTCKGYEWPHERADGGFQITELLEPRRIVGERYVSRFRMLTWASR
jgi:hypothetical protein